MRLGIRTRLRELGLYPELPAHGGWRHRLSRWSWRAYGPCDAGEIARTGVAIFPLPPKWAARFTAEVEAAPPDAIRADDLRPGYFHEVRPSEMDYLNGVNEYRAVTPTLLQGLREFLAENRKTIEESVGHPWRARSVRLFRLRPSDRPAGTIGNKHFDGWPPAIRKLFILPGGATPQSGTTWFKLRDGGELLLDQPQPIWTIFENSRVEHALTPGKVPRPTIELNIVPARRTSTEPLYVGINNWYPLFPWN